VFREYLPAPRVDLDLPGDRHPGAFQAEIESADAGEQRQDVHRLSRILPLASHGASLG
jgi:hypothetical protein